MATSNAIRNGVGPMSFKLISKALDLKVGNPLRKLVLIQLADQANDDCVCWPSYEYIANSCEMSRRSVVDHIQWLADNDFLWIEKRYNAEESKNFSNRYHLTLSKAKQFKKVDKKTKGSAGAAPLNNSDDSANAALGSANAALGSANAALGSANAAPSSSAGAAPKPITKPINEPVKEAVRTDDTAEQVKNVNAEFIVNWNPPSRETMEAKLFMAGTPMQMTDGQYQLYVGDFKAHFEDRAKEGYPLKSDGKCQAKLRDWLQRERDSHNKNMNAGGDTANRPHSNRSDAFSSGNEPKLTRQQQIDLNKQAMQQAGLSV